MSKKKKETIAAVIVTYNRRELLKECLRALLNQTRKPNSIIIMDNASTDGTQEMLKKEFLRKKIFDYVRLKTNTGGAGGFHYGMKRAYKKGFDWIWVMDDDVKVIPNAIKIYLKYAPLSNFIQGRRKNKNGTVFKWAQYLNYKTGRRIAINEEDIFKNKSYIKTNVACFEGAFINRKVIKKIGLPKKEFFIQEDDTLYGVMATFKGEEIIYIKEIILMRMNEIIKKTFLWKEVTTHKPISTYYMLRNKFYLEKYIKKLSGDKKIDHSAVILKAFLKTFLKVLIIEKGKIEFFKSVYLAYSDGHKFRPV